MHCLCLGPVTPTNCRAAVLSPHTIKVTWDQTSSSGVTGYLISYTTTASYTSGGSVTVNGSSTTSGTLNNLEENTLYTITVQAISNSRTSGNSNKVSVTTMTDSKLYLISCHKMSLSILVKINKKKASKICMPSKTTYNINVGSQ